MIDICWSKLVLIRPKGYKGTFTLPAPLPDAVEVNVFADMHSSCLVKYQAHLWILLNKILLLAQTIPQLVLMFLVKGSSLCALFNFLNCGKVLLFKILK